MFVWIQSCRCIVRSLYTLSSMRTDGNLYRLHVYDYSFQNSLRTYSNYCLPIQHFRKPLNLLGLQSMLNRTLVCKCSTFGDSTEKEGVISNDDDCTGVNDEKNCNRSSDESPLIKAARLELEMLRNSGRLVPESISDADLEYFCTLTSKNGRKRFAVFLARKEQLRLKEREKRMKLREEKDLESPFIEQDLDEPLKNRMFLRLQPNSILQFDNWRLASAMKFGPKVAYDFSYDEYMQRPEIISLVMQMMHTIGANKLAKDPFDIHWVGLKEGSATMREMRRMFKEHFNNHMVSPTDREVQDVFPVEDIVYLTSDSPNILRSYNPSKVYVLGALVDSHKILRGVSFAKAKRLNLNHARLPLDLFLKWSSGGKNLTLDQMIQILIELNTSGDWTKALSHVPTRKHTGLKLEPPPKHFTEKRMSKDGSPRQQPKYSFSRAKNSHNRPKLDEPPFQRSKRVNSVDEENPASENNYKRGK